MAIRVISPVNLDEGHLVALTADGKMDETKAVIGGQVVKLVESTESVYGGEPHIEASKDDDVLATAFPYGFVYKASKAEPANNLYIPFNQYKAPLNRQSVILTKGFRAELWNDGTGVVFEEKVKNAKPGTLLYVSANGTLTTDANATATNVGSMAVAVVEIAPADANGVLTIQAII